MSEQSGPARREPPPQPQPPKAEGFSQFIGKVLDQLSLSAWLPAAMLVANAAVLIQLSYQHDLDLRAAVVALTSSPLAVIVAALFGLVVGTILTQAFQFEAIRLLEGYWGTGWIASTLSKRRIRTFGRKLLRLRARRSKYVIRAAEGAWDVLRERRLGDRLPPLEELIHAQTAAPAKAHALEEKEEELQWKMFSRAEDLRRVDAVDEELEGYPKDSRLLPTRLGNTLRAYEDELGIDEGRLEGFMLRRFDLLPTFIQLEHDQFRTRLDMYCALTVVFCVLALAGPAALLHDSGRLYLASAGAFVVYSALAVISYRAATASAKGYGSILIEAEERLTQQNTLNNDEYQA